MFLEKFRIDGKIAVVTGAARGIGLSASEALAEAGAKVVLTDMSRNCWTRLWPSYPPKVTALKANCWM